MARQTNMHVNCEQADIIDHINKTVTDIRAILWGNGNPGLKTEVAVMKTSIAEVASEVKDLKEALKDRRAVSIGLVISVVLIVLTAAVQLASNVLERGIRADGQTSTQAAYDRSSQHIHQYVPNDSAGGPAR